MSATPARGAGRTPLQNRVDPTGALVATPERGGLMGNRGILHDDRQRLRLPRGWRPGRLLFTHRHWIICRLAFKDRHRAVMTPRRYTELFFLDEATALAAGHRPCRECQGERYAAFRAAWAAGQGLDRLPGRDEIDGQLHAERLAPDFTRRTYPERLGHVPDGAIVALEPGGPPLLVLGDALLAWSFAGYGAPEAGAPDRIVHVLTPRSTVAALAHGYRPALHPTAAIGLQQGQLV
ncbi:MAG: hypothetical protein IT340_10920 [Chloroflexi bacterium]|nr:hypothetical protein [Chloroflexota bacterium]